MCTAIGHAVQYLGCNKRYVILFACVLLLCLLIGEWIQPLLCMRDWEIPPYPPDQDEVRLLLVADPHLQGYHRFWYYLEYVAILDSDWYLKRYYTRILTQTRPTAVLFLGDLLDRGTVASSDELFDTLDRFQRIFVPDSENLVIFLVPGDNDVGGEWDDPLTEEKMSRFRAHFVSYPRTRRVQFVQLFVDPLNVNWTASYTGTKDRDGTDLISVYVSHFPMVTPYGSNFPPSLIRCQPSLLINGHDHVAYALHWEKHDPNESERIRWLVPPDSPGHGPHTGPFLVHRLTGSVRQQQQQPQRNRTDLIGSVIQLGVPSCSYRSGRLGASRAAYGLVRVYRNRSMTYQLFRLPDRRSTLLFYASALSMLAALGLFLIPGHRVPVRGRTWCYLRVVPTVYLFCTLLYFFYDAV